MPKSFNRSAVGPGRVAPSLALILILILIFGGAAGGARAGDWRYLLNPPASLSQVERDVAARFTDVRQVTPADLAAMQAAGAPLLLVDVREAPEFAVGHLAGAVRLDPDASATAARAALSARARGRTVIFYCSVGQRSSIMARRAQRGLLEDGAAGAANLRGGVFAWHNAGRPLVNAAGPTRFVHPFNATWGRLLTHPALISTTPR